MCDIRINTKRKDTSTLVSNTFIDQFMPSANGTFVKVYLYLLRCQSGDSAPFSISSAADLLDETEKDITRAIAYWEKKNVLEVIKQNDEIVGITLLELTATRLKKPEISIIEDQSVVTFNSNAETEPVSEPAEEPAIMRTIPSYTRKEIDKALNNPDISWLADIVGTYLERLITNEDISLILFMYNELGFSKELILHVYETCIERKKTGNKYIQTIAINWFNEGIDSVDKAVKQAALYDAYFNAVNKAFNLRRLPGDKEQLLIRSWRDMGFSPEMVKEACDRALLNCGKTSFAYADKTLKNWNEKGIKDIAALSASDKSFSAAKPQQTKKTAVSKSAAAYNKYMQTDYSESDIREIERQLLAK